MHTRVNIQIVPLDPSFLLCRKQQGALWGGCAWEKIPSLVFSSIPCWIWAQSLVDVGRYWLVASTFLWSHWLRCDSLCILKSDTWSVLDTSENSKGYKGLARERQWNGQLFAAGVLTDFMSHEAEMISLSRINHRGLPATSVWEFHFLSECWKTGWFCYFEEEF